MFFINELHEKNFSHLTDEIFVHTKGDKEYEVMCYIFALPELYARCIEDPLLNEYPFLWTTDYKYKEELVKDEKMGDYYDLDIDIKKDNDDIEMESEGFSKLSHGYQLMVYLAANLFNSGDNEFNLTYSIDRWDEQLINVFHQALHIRFSL